MMLEEATLTGAPSGAGNGEIEEINLSGTEGTMEDSNTLNLSYVHSYLLQHSHVDSTYSI